MQAYLKDEHEYTKEEVYKGISKFEHEFTIGETPVSVIDDNGNVSESLNHKLHLEYKGNPITRDYWNIIELDDDHYIVCDIQVSGCYLEDINEYSLNEVEKYLNPVFKFKNGIIRLKRDKEGNVVPFQERLVVPVVYDRISENNNKTITAYNGDKMTYVDLDPKSSNYGMQLVPAKLTHAEPFDLEHEGFARCGNNNVEGFLPRNNTPIDMRNDKSLFYDFTYKKQGYDRLYFDRYLRACLIEETNLFDYDFSYVPVKHFDSLDEQSQRLIIKRNATNKHEI